MEEFEKYLRIEGDVVHITKDLILYYIGYREEVCKFLSNKTLIVDECGDEYLFMLYNLEGSIVNIKTLLVDCTNPSIKVVNEGDRIKEMKEALEFEFETSRGTKVKIEKWKLTLNLARSPSNIMHRLWKRFNEIDAGTEERIVFKFCHESDRFVKDDRQFLQYFDFVTEN